MVALSPEFRRIALTGLRSPTGLVAATVVTAGLAVSTMSLGSTAAPDPSVGRPHLAMLAHAMGGAFTEAALGRAFGTMDPAMLALAQEEAPAPRPRLAGTADALGQTSDEGTEPEVAAFSARAIKALSWDAARLVNDSIPYANDAVAPARPFKLIASAEDRARAVQCLSEAVYYEAGFEPRAGQEAVAQVILNRMRHPIFPKTVCGVVYQGSQLPTGCQFTFTCDGSLGRPPEDHAFARARDVAMHALDGFVAKGVGEATHYHAEYVVPYWLPTLTKLTKVGAHIFYRWSGGMGAPAAFHGQYAGGEPLLHAKTVDRAAEVKLADQKDSKPVEVADAGPIATLIAPNAPVVAHETLELKSAPVLAQVAPTIHQAPRQVWSPPSGLGGGCSGFGGCR